MLTESSPLIFHRIQSFLLVVIALSSLPISTLFLWSNYCLHTFVYQNGGRFSRRRSHREPHFTPKTILITGVGNAIGLKTARAFYETGHKVVGADVEEDDVPVNARFSKALWHFYELPKVDGKTVGVQYIQELVRIVEKEKVDLWVNCRGATTAMDDCQAKEILQSRTSCTCLQFDVATTRLMLDQDAFSQYVAEIGLPALESQLVTSRDSIHKALSDAHPRKKYILKDSSDGSIPIAPTTLLPRRTVSQTYQHVSGIKVSKDNPWTLQQYVQGDQYRILALIVQGYVKAFVAYSVDQGTMYYQALRPESHLSKAMLNFTREFAENQGSDCTGHISISFTVDETVTKTGVELQVFPTEARPFAQAAGVLLHCNSHDLIAAYLETLPTDQTNGYENEDTILPNGCSDSEIILASPNSIEGFYWIGQDLVSLVLIPFVNFLMRRTGFFPFLSSLFTFIRHFVFSKDGTYEVWDPLPTWWLYQVQWPLRLLEALARGRKWSQIDVSTGEMVGY